MFKVGFNKLISFIPPELVALLIIIGVPAVLIMFVLGKIESPIALKQDHIKFLSPNTISTPSSFNATSTQIMREESDKNTNTPTQSSLDNSPQPTSAPYSSINNTKQIYPIIPLGDISSLSDNQKTQIIAIYNDFRNTPNLQYMTSAQQQEIFRQKADAYLEAYKNQLQQQTSQLQTDVNQLKAQQSIANNTDEQVNPQVETKLEELRQTLEGIYQQPVAMNVIYGRLQRAYQDWIKNNSEMYSTILGSTKYSDQLNSILAGYGL